MDLAIGVCREGSIPTMRWGDRRKESRDEDTDRRQYPRPPLWLNLLILFLAVAVGAVALVHRRALNDDFKTIISGDRTHTELVQEIQEGLTDLDLSREELEQELDARIRRAESLQSERFHIAIDTQKKEMRFHYGEDVIRTAPVTLGPPTTVTTPDGKQWTFPALKGAFNVTGKERGMTWRVPDWVWEVNPQAEKQQGLSVKDGLGRYVLLLPNGYVIHSPPPEESPLKGPKPGSFQVPEEDLRAIWPRVEKGTDVFIF